MKTGARLHSHEVKYGSDGGSSGQNSVTGMNSQQDPNSLWKVVEATSAKGASCPIGQQIKCGDRFRLKHATSGCYLHSHSNFKSPLSKNQEVSGLGCPSSPNHGRGDNDPGDDWELACKDWKPSDGERFWGLSDQVRFKHVRTGKYLHHTGKHTYNRPIAGQREICAISKPNDNSLWIVQEGLMPKVRTPDTKQRTRDAGDL